MSRRASHTPAASSPFNSLPMPRNETRGSDFRAALFQARQERLFPGGIGHLHPCHNRLQTVPGLWKPVPTARQTFHAVEAAINHALRAVGALVRVVAHDKFLVDLVDHEQFDGVGRAVFDAQLAAGTFFGIPDQVYHASFPEHPLLQTDTSRLPVF